MCQGRLAVGLGVSHHWVIDEMLGLPYEHPVATMSAYLDVLDQALAGPGPVDVENDVFPGHNPLDITDVTPTPVLLAALGPRMLQLCGDRTDGTVLWMADERAIGTHVVPNLTQGGRGGRPAGPPGGGRRPGVPVRRPGDRRRRGPDQPDPGRGGGLTQLPEAARSWVTPEVSATSWLAGSESTIREAPAGPSPMPA